MHRRYFPSTNAQEMHLSPDSRSFKMWKTPPIPISIDIYLFNWTNPTNFDDDHVKPILVECGPYRFTENMDKVDLVWSPHNSTVSYRKKSTFFFDEAGSKGRLNDTITTLNIIALVSLVVLCVCTGRGHQLTHCFWHPPNRRPPQRE